MDAAAIGIIATGAVGLAGTVATFFAPPWTQRKIERRRERRDFRRATRLVAHELGLNAGRLKQAGRVGASMAEFHAKRLSARAWDAERGLLAERLDSSTWRIIANIYVMIENDRAMLENFAEAKGALQYEQSDQEEFESTAAKPAEWSTRLLEAKEIVE